MKQMYKRRQLLPLLLILAHLTTTSAIANDDTSADYDTPSASDNMDYNDRNHEGNDDFGNADGSQKKVKAKAKNSSKKQAKAKAKKAKKAKHKAKAKAKAKKAKTKSKQKAKAQKKAAAKVKREKDSQYE